MGFELIARGTRARNSPAVLVTQRKTGITDIRVHARVAAKMGLPTDSSHKAILAVLIGTDEHKGLVQIRPAKESEAPVKHATLHRGHFSVHLKPRDLPGEIPPVDSSKPQAAAFAVEGNTLTVELPEPLYAVSASAKAYMQQHSSLGL